MEYLIEIGKNARQAARSAAKMNTKDKNDALILCGEKLLSKSREILAANSLDVMAAKESGKISSFIDRLTLTEGRIKDMAEGLRLVAALDDPVGEVVSMRTMPNGLTIGQKRVPMGVVGIIYEARPNVSSDAFGLCLKAGSAVILRGGKEALNSNLAIIDAFREALKENGYNQNLVQMLNDTSRETAGKFMKLNKYIDVLIPRGGAGLIQSVIENSTIPVIETGVGNCHIFVDASANIETAVKIIINAKTQRPGVCNACEKVLVHKDIAHKLLPGLCQQLKEKNVEIRGDEKARGLVDYIIEATEQDWYTEYLDYIIGIKVVNNIDEAIEHIETYGTRHSESIITESYENSQKFLQEIDSAAVYVNASTRFTDGYEFGFGAEIGISTQKLHARGPMGLKELTTTKYIILGNGQVRE